MPTPISPSSSVPSAVRCAKYLRQRSISTRQQQHEITQPPQGALAHPKNDEIVPHELNSKASSAAKNRRQK
jgi:hypothetical protein